MRRPARGEQSAFSLFPFLAVLMCTMGSLVVLLVAMAHISRSKAQLEAEAARVAASAAANTEDSKRRQALEVQLSQTEAALSRLRLVKADGVQHLQQEQKRLSDIEDHLSRLRSESEALIAETKELIAVEDQHYDDAKVADQELERLNRLAGEIEEEIEGLKHAAAGRERKFAVVPLRDDRTGTLRPPVYYECTESGVILQPEGIKLTWQDLVAGDFSSPVTAAARAVTRYYEEHPEARAANELGRPYPLLIVRPDGVYSYYQARAALDGADVDYGYQPVAADWPLEYGQPNPVLASLVSDAVTTARAEREGLAKVIPQLGAAISAAESDAQLAIAHSHRPASAGNYSAMGGFGEGGSGSVIAAPGGIRVRPANRDSNNPFEGLRIEGALAGEVGSVGSVSNGYGGLGSGATGILDEATQGSQPSPLMTGMMSPTSADAAAQSVSGFGSQGSGSATTGPAGIASTAPDQGANPSTETSDGSVGQRYGAVAANSSPGKNQSAAPGESQNALVTNGNQAEAGGTGGQTSVSVGSKNKSSRSTIATSGAPQNASARDGVPMVRPIRLYVSHDSAVVLPDSAQSLEEMAKAAKTTQAVKFDGSTSSRINDVIAMLKRHADTWGIAGDGMYWDPRLVLNVPGDGVQRADDVRRLLEAAGVKVQAYPVTTAVNTSGGSNAPR